MQRLRGVDCAGPPMARTGCGGVAESESNWALFHLDNKTNLPAATDSFDRYSGSFSGSRVG